MISFSATGIHHFCYFRLENGIDFDLQTTAIFCAINAVLLLIFAHSPSKQKCHSSQFSPLAALNWIVANFSRVLHSALCWLFALECQIWQAPLMNLLSVTKRKLSHPRCRDFRFDCTCLEKIKKNKKRIPEAEKEIVVYTF